METADNINPEMAEKEIQTARECQLGIERIDKYLAWVFIIALAIVPLLIRGHNGLFIAPRFIAETVNSGMRMDFITYYKTVLLYLLAMLALFLLLLKIFLYDWEIRSSYINIPLLVLALIIFLSGILAEYKGIALFGMYKRREGTVTYLAYLLLFFAAANTSFKPWFERLVRGGLSLVLLINVIFITFSFFGHDLFNVAAVKAFLVPAGQSAVGNLKSTLNNVNYVSGFASALTAFFLALALNGSAWKERIIWASASVLSFALMLAAVSASGWVALVLSLPLLAVIARKSQALRPALLTAGVVMLSWILVFLLLNSHNPQVGGQTMDILQPIITHIHSKQIPGSASNPPAQTVNDAITAGSKAANEFNLPAPGLSAGSGRIYIWEKTIDLIKDRPVLGYGLDTIAYYFPQNDPESISGLGSIYTIIDKPHNAYLEIAYGSGLIALAVFLLLLTLHLYYSSRSLFSRYSTVNTGFQQALLVFFLAFIIQWLFNDSIVGTSVIFWILMGISVSMGNSSEQAGTEAN